MVSVSLTLVFPVLTYITMDIGQAVFERRSPPWDVLEVVKVLSVVALVGIVMV